MDEVAQFFIGPGNQSDLCGVPVCLFEDGKGATRMNGIIYIIGLIVVIMAILSFLGLH